MIKKILFIVFLVITVSVTGCKGSDVENNALEATDDKGEIQEVTNDGIEDNEELEGLEVENKGGRTRIVFEDRNYLIGTANNLNWQSGDRFIFSFKHSTDNGASSMIYRFNGSQGSIDKLFEIDGEIWGAGAVVEDGKKVIYSYNGFDGLYALKEDGTINQITKAQSWYHLSPDEKRIIINGIPADDSHDSEHKRYIYDIDKELLEESPLIPDMDYAFSYIAARWSPNAIHISSQTGDQANKLAIINGVENTLEQEIMMEDALITVPIWSPDGKKLAFMVQSKDKKGYIIEGEHLYFYMSDKIGIYDTEDRTVSYIDLGEQLTFGNLMWKPDSKGIFQQTASSTVADQIIDQSIEGTRTVEAHLNYLDIESKEIMHLFTRDAIMDYYNIPSIAQPLDLYHQNQLLYYTFREDGYALRVFDLEKKSDREIFQDTYHYDGRWYQLESGSIFITNSGILFLDNAFNMSLVVDLEEYRETDVMFIDVSISPDYQKSIIAVEYQPDSGKKNFMEIVDLPFEI